MCITTTCLANIMCLIVTCRQKATHLTTVSEFRSMLSFTIESDTNEQISEGKSWATGNLPPWKVGRILGEQRPVSGEAPPKECNKTQVPQVLYWISHVPARRV